LLELSDSIHASDRLYFASCPPIGAPLTTPIAISKIDYQESVIQFSKLTSTALSTLNSSFQLMVLNIGNNPNYLTLFYTKVSIAPSDIAEALAGKIPVYFMPSMICPVEALPNSLDEAQIVATRRISELNQSENRIQTESGVIRKLASCLNIPVESIGSDDNFFVLGGDSLLKAGQSASKIRKMYPSIFFQLVKYSPILLPFNLPNISNPQNG